MDIIPEVIITSSNVCTVHDANTGNLLKTYKENFIAPRTLGIIDESFIIGAVANKPAIKIWTVSQKESTTFPCIGVVTSLAVSNCGTYCVGGIRNEIHIWRISTGELLNTVERHYQDLTCVRFTSDDSHVLSGGKDGHVMVWIFSELVAYDIERGEVKTRFVWIGHNAEVTDIYTGSLGSESRVATTSLDTTCRLYELDSGILLSVICMDVPLTAVVMDAIEYFLFLGDQHGSVYRINTSVSLPTEIHRTQGKTVQFQMHEKKIISLSVSMDGMNMMSSSEDNTCKMWDMESMACLLTIPHEGKITNAFLAPKPTMLSNPMVPPHFTIRAFKRDFQSTDAIRTFVETKPRSLPLSFMKRDGDRFYSSVLLQGSVKSSGEDTDASKYFENMFQETIHGDSVNDLKEVNNQLYTQLLKQGMDNLPAND